MQAPTGPLDVRTYPLCANDEISATIKQNVTNLLEDLTDSPIIVDFRVDHQFVEWFSRATGHLVIERGGAAHRALCQRTGQPIPAVANLPINTHKVPHALSQLAEQTEFANLRFRSDALEIGPSPKGLPDCDWSTLLDGRTQSRFVQASLPSDSAAHNAQAIIRGMGAEHLSLPCTTLFANMVAHDLSHKQLYKIFEATGATSGKFSALIPPQIILGADFRNESFGISYKFDHSSDTATMLMDDMSFGYTHKISNLTDWLTKPVYNGPKFSLLFEVVRSYQVMIIVQVTRVTRASVAPIRHVPGGVGMTRVLDLTSCLPYIRRWGDQLFQGLLDPHRFLEKLKGLKCFWVPTAIWNKACAYGDARDDKHITRQAFHSYLNALCYEITVSGHTVQRGFQLAPTAQNSLTMSLLISCMVRRWYSTKALSYLTREVQVGGGSLFERIKGTLSFCLTTSRGADSIYSYDSVHALTGMSRRHYLLLQLIDTVDEPRIDFTGIVREHGSATILNLPCNDTYIDVDPDDDGYCYHHCAMAAFGVDCGLPRNPTVGQIQAFETTLSVNSPIILSNGHATVKVHSSSVCSHLMAKVIPQRAGISARFKIVENWAENLAKFRIAPAEGLNILKTTELLSFMGSVTGSIKTVHNLCALPLNDLPAWRNMTVTHHVNSHADSLDSGKLITLPAGQFIKFDTNISCPACLPRDWNMVVADFGQDSPSATQHEMNIINLINSCPRGVYKMQDFYKTCASSDSLTRLISTLTVLEIHHAQPWERFIIWGRGLVPGYYTSGGSYRPWSTLISGYGTPAYHSRAIVLNHHNPLSWPPHRLARTVSKLSDFAAKFRAARLASLVERVAELWLGASRLHIFSTMRAEAADAAAAAATVAALHVALAARAKRAACTIQRAYRVYRLQHAHAPAGPSLPADFDASTPPPASEAAADAAVDNIVDLPPTAAELAVGKITENVVGGDESSYELPLFNMAAWARTLASAGGPVPDTDFSRYLTSCEASHDCVEDVDLLRIWLTRPDISICLSSSLLPFLAAYVIECNSDAILNHIKDHNIAFGVHFNNPLRDSAYHGNLYYAGSTLRGIPFAIPAPVPAVVDLDFGHFSANTEMRILHDSFKSDLKGKYGKVNSAALDFVIKNPKLDRQHFGKVQMINGIPGCGKTKLMIKTFTSGGWDIVVCPTSALAEEYRAEMIPCKTTVSAIPNISGKSVIIDEAYKMGIIELVYILTHCARALLVGDSEQTSYNADDYSSRLKCSILPLVSAVKGVVPRITVSHAVPLDIMHWIHGRWPDKRAYTTTSCVTDSVRYFNQGNQTGSTLRAHLALNPDNSPSTRMLCFSKKSQELMQFETVNAQQGYRSKLAGLYIGASCASTLSIIPQQLYVAMTRHTKMLHIYLAKPAGRLNVSVTPVHICPCEPSRPCMSTEPCNGRCSCHGLKSVGLRNAATDVVIGSRSNQTVFGRLAVRDVDFTIAESFGASIAEGSSGASAPPKIFGIPRDAATNMQVHGNLHLSAENAPHSDPAISYMEDEPEIAEVLIPPVKEISTLAIDEVLQKLAPTSSDVFESRRQTAYTNLGDLKQKTLKIKMRQRPIMDPHAKSVKTVIPIMRCRSRAQTTEMDHALHSAISRYSNASTRISNDKLSSEVTKLMNGLDKFVKVRGITVATPEMLALAEAEACQNIVKKHNPARQDEGLYGASSFATSTISCFNKVQDKAGLKTETWMQGSADSRGEYTFKAGQPISASPKTMNHICMAYVRCLELEIIRNLRRGVHLPNGSSMPEFKKALDRDLSSLPPGVYETVCTDISEQDTTKTAAVHEVVKRLFSLIGTPEHVIEILFSTLRAWSARGLDYNIWSLDAFQSGSSMTYLNNTVDNMARVGSAFNIRGPFVAGFKGDDGFLRAQSITQARFLKELKIERGITGTFVGYLIGDVLTLDLPRLANKAACRTYVTVQQAHEYATAVADWLSMIPTNEAGYHMVTLNAVHYGLSRGEAELLWSYLVWFAHGGFARCFFERSANHTSTYLYRKIVA